MRSSILNSSGQMNTQGSVRRPWWSARVYLALLLVVRVAAVAQSNVNEEQGLKPYDALHGGDLDTVSLTNGGLALHIPLASFPQRGNIDLSFFLRGSSKGWQVYAKPSCHNPGCNPTYTYSWIPARGISGAQVVSTLDWWVQTTGTIDPSYIETVSSPDGNLHQIGGSSSSSTPLYPAYSFDATGLLRPDGNTVIMPNGTRFSYVNGFGNNLFAGTQPSSVTDANGNQITITSSGWTDTLGRQIPGTSTAGQSPQVQPGVPTTDLSNCPSGTSSAMVWNVPGVAGVNNGIRTFKFCYSMVTLSTNFQQSGVTEYPATSTPLLTAIVLPNLTMWTLAYDSYGDITTLGFPTGGSISYTYTNHATPNCSSTQTATSRWVTSRTVNANDGTGGHTWNYSYANTTTTVTSPDGNDTVHTISTPVQNAPCSLFDTQVQYYQGTGGNRTLLKTVATQYSSIASLYYANTEPLAINVVPSQVTTTWPGGHNSKVVGTYDSGGTDANGNPYIFGSVLQKDEYDFSNSLARSTLSHFLWQDSATYKSNNFLSLVDSTTVKDGSGNQVAQTTYSYDQAAVTVSGITTGLVSPPAGGNTRGNQTTVSHWLNTNNSTISGTATYFDTGMKASATDPLSHTTTYTYSSAFAGAYMTQTNLPDTQMPDQGAPIVHHIVSGNYDFNTGLMTSFIDENGQQFSYSYDVMLRLTQGNHPDGGQTIFTYPDANTVTRQRLITSANYEGLYTAKFDGVGRAYEDLQVTPSGTVEVDTTYDPNGREASVSNPYYQGSNHSTDPTYGVVQTQYDALSRVVKTTKQDSSVASVSYSDNCTTTTDEAGNQREVCSDALGRMTEVLEQNPGAAATYATGWLSISGSEQSAQTQQAKSASVTVTIGGSEVNNQYETCTKTCVWHNIPDTGTVQFSVNAGGTTIGPVTFSYGATSTAANLAGNLYTYFQNNFGSNSSVTMSNPNGGTSFTLTSIPAGSVMNSWTVSGSVTSNCNPNNYVCNGPGFTISPTSANFSGGQNAATTYDTGTVTATINGTAYQVSYGSSDTSTSIASRLASAISAGSYASATASGSTINLTSKTSGTAGDYSLSASYTWNSSQFTNPSFTTSTSGSALSGALNASALNNNPFVTLYQYDALNNLLCVHQKATDTSADVTCTGGSPPSVPASWRQRFFTYDSLSRLVTASNPEAGTITYNYDNVGNLTSKVEPMANQVWGSSQTVTITYAYDALSRLTDKTYSDNTQSSSYRYDYSSYLGQSFQYPIGRQVSATAANNTIAYFTSYDSMGRVKQATQCIPGVTNCQNFSAGYDLLGDMLSLTYPGNNFSVTYQYDSAARLVQASDSNGVIYAQNPTILASGAMQEFTSPNFSNNKFHTNLNNRLQPTEIWGGASQGSGALFDKQYSYNPPNMSQMNNGNIYTVTNVKDGTRTQTFTYDVLNRLISAGDGSHWGNTYTYDAWGNLQKVPGNPAGENFQHAADTNNHLTGFSYDAAGNMTNDGATSYVYDSENRITSATAGGVTTTYTYDADGRRVKKSSGPNYWYGPGGNALAETDLNGNWTFYIFFGGQRLARNIPQPPPNAADIKYYVTDHLHSTAMFVDQSGSVLDDNDFYPWGGVVPGVGKTTSTNTVKFTGKYRDTESGLDYFGARYYANVSGRWMSPDWAAKPTMVPYAVFGDPQSLNLYAYVRNSPVVRVDADGHTPAILDTPMSDRFTGMTWGADNGVDQYDVTTTEDSHGHITQTIQQVGSSTFLYDGPPIVSTTLPTTPGTQQQQSSANTGCSAQARAKIVGVPGHGFKHAIKQVLMHLLRIKHMFWTVKGSDGVEMDLSGGPNKGFLGEWSTPTSKIYPPGSHPRTEAEYRDSGKVFFTAPQSADLCSRVDAMERLASPGGWPAGINYNPSSGPNSNGSFNAVGNAGGMPLLSPFWTPGAKNVPF